MVQHAEMERQRQGKTAPGDELHPWEDFVAYQRQFTRQRPEVVAFTCFTLGFIVGWRLKPW